MRRSTNVGGLRAGATRCRYVFFFFNDTATTEIYTLSLHDALPIWTRTAYPCSLRVNCSHWTILCFTLLDHRRYQREHRCVRSEEHTSELQSRQYLVCRLLLEKKTAQPSSTDCSSISLTLFPPHIPP